MKKNMRKTIEMIPEDKERFKDRMIEMQKVNDKITEMIMNL